MSSTYAKPATAVSKIKLFNPIKVLLSPIQNSAIFTKDWIQRRPRITQNFGLNPQIYEQFNMRGHNGVDYGVSVGTPIYSPCICSVNAVPPNVSVTKPLIVGSAK